LLDVSIDDVSEAGFNAVTKVVVKEAFEALETVTMVCHTSCEVKNCVRTSRSAPEDNVAEVDGDCTG
jgi:hypothetical protein